jgi:hypothetical protein
LLVCKFCAKVLFPKFCGAWGQLFADHRDDKKLRDCQLDEQKQSRGFEEF